MSVGDFPTATRKVTERGAKARLPCPRHPSTLYSAHFPSGKFGLKLYPLSSQHYPNFIPLSIFGEPTRNLEPRNEGKCLTACMGGSTRHLESDFQQNCDRSDWKAPQSATLRQGAWVATQEAKCWSCKPENPFIGFSEPTKKLGVLERTCNT